MPMTATCITWSVHFSNSRIYMPKIWYFLDLAASNFFFVKIFFTIINYLSQFPLIFELIDRKIKTSIPIFKWTNLQFMHSNCEIAILFHCCQTSSKLNNSSRQLFLKSFYAKSPPCNRWNAFQVSSNNQLVEGNLIAGFYCRTM